MKRGNKITLYITVTLFVIYLAVSTGFVAAKQQSLVCNSMQITVCDSMVNRFISCDKVEKIITDDVGKIIGEYVSRINVHQMEQLLNKRSVIYNTEVFSSIDGVLHVDVYQRRPIVRVQTSVGGFYIDETGYIFPLSLGVYTSFVPILTGNVPSKLTNDFRGIIPKKEIFLQQLYDFALFLDDNEFWRSQIVQIHVNSASDVLLLPRVGHEKIHIGALTDYESKLDKLNVFYHKVRAADEENYSDIDLRYSNQIICKRK